MLRKLVPTLIYSGLALLVGSQAYLAWFRPQRLVEAQKKVFRLEQAKAKHGIKAPLTKHRRARFDENRATWILWRRVLYTLLFLLFLILAVAAFLVSGVLYLR